MLKSIGLFAFLSATLAAQSNPVVDWNRHLLAILRTPGAQPAKIHSTRSFAMMHAAIYDAVNRIDGTHQSYGGPIPGGFPPSRSPQAEDVAAATAAHAVLVALYPGFQSQLDSEYQQALSKVHAAPLVQEGITVGEAAAARILALRANDGAGVPAPPFTFGSGPGAYQSTPPNFPKPVFTTWSQVTPWVLGTASQFRPAPPPALTSSSYSDVLNQVESLGIINGTAASPDQKLTGVFWNAAIQNYWNEIAQTAALSRQLNTPESSRLFALLNLTFADCAIAFYDAKYTFQFWRPVTAIRAADTDGNPNTAADPNWLPDVTNTPADPSYPGAHAVISAAGAAILSSVLGSDQFNLIVSSELMPGTTRSFTSFSAAADEATLSRIFAGVHTRLDEDAGAQLGASVAAYVVGHALLPAVR
jgi:hypothetical protein